MQYGKIGKSVLRHRRSEPVSDSSHHGDFFFFTLIINNLALTYSLKYDNANKMRQCENIFVFIDLTKSIGSDLGGQCPPGPPKLRLCLEGKICVPLAQLLQAGVT